MLITLTITSLVVSVSSIALTYEVRNGGPSTVYVFDTLYRTDRAGNRTTDSTLAYVLSTRDAVIVGKFLVPVPYGIKVESPEIPYLAALAPGGKLSGQVTLPLPLELYDPYVRQRATADLSQRLALRIGFIDSNDIRQGQAVVNKTPDGKFICDYGYGLELQKFVETQFTVNPPSRR